jgi:hypothetical protein
VIATRRRHYELLVLGMVVYRRFPHEEALLLLSGIYRRALHCWVANRWSHPRISDVIARAALVAPNFEDELDAAVRLLGLAHAADTVLSSLLRLDEDCRALERKL